MRKLWFLLAALLLLCLAACGEAKTESDGLLVLIEEGEGFSVENNAQQVAPGEDAVFYLHLMRGTALLGTDYSGPYEITEQDGQTVLRLKNLRYPTRVRLSLASKSGQILYEANDGSGASLLKSYSQTVHPRPNTALGTELFSRAGYTLWSWNTAPDGSGERVGLGSRVTLPGGELRLYAQWAPWSPEADFSFADTEGGVTITGYHGADDSLVIPGTLGGLPVRKIAAGAFQNCAASAVILPPGLQSIEPGAFVNCALSELTLFDDLADFSDACFIDCAQLKTLHINAVEAPYGYMFRKESCYADKVDLLMLARGCKKLVFYGGCSMWYNLDGLQADKLFGGEYAILNLALNGTVSSAVQLQIMTPYLEPGDILLHTPEISSREQLMLVTDMRDDDSSLWCGIENNYDLFALVDLRTVGGVFDSLCHYLGMKDKRTDYLQFFSDDYRTPYLDSYGCIPFYRSEHSERLADKVNVKPELLEKLDTLRSYYARLHEQGVRVYVSCACVNLDALPEGEAAQIPAADAAFIAAISGMDGAAPISHLEDYLYHNGDYYDTNYHLLSEPAKRNTALWLRDLLAQMVKDGLWEGEA